MNAKTFAIVAFGFANFASHAQAADTSLSPVAVSASNRAVVDCRDERLPSRQAVGELLDSNNAGYVNGQREVLGHVAHRECMRGAATVVFVRDDSTSPASLAFAEAITRR